MPEISPKAKALTDPIFIAQHKAMVNSDRFEESAMIALAELARMNLSAEVMRGANLFLDTFQNLAEGESKLQRSFPHKHLIDPANFTASEPKKSQ